MSRSYRKYRGLSHTQSNTKQGKAWKKIDRKRTRAQAKASEDGVELAKKCARGNYYGGNCFSEFDYEYIASRRSLGYSSKRVKHKIWGK